MSWFEGAGIMTYSIVTRPLLLCWLEIFHVSAISANFPLPFASSNLFQPGTRILEIYKYYQMLIYICTIIILTPALFIWLLLMNDYTSLGNVPVSRNHGVIRTTYNSKISCLTHLNLLNSMKRAHLILVDCDPLHKISSLAIKIIRKVYRWWMIQWTNT